MILYGPVHPNLHMHESSMTRFDLQNSDEGLVDGLEISTARDKASLDKNYYPRIDFLNAPCVEHRPSQDLEEIPVG